MAKVLEFIPSKKGKKSKGPSDFIERGKIDSLDYTVFNRGTIHIKDNNNLIFKKSCDVFEDEINKLQLNNMKEGEIKEIPGSGDNDSLVFHCENGDIKISLKKREYSMVTKLKEILKQGTRKREVENG